jgi:hypothetical protein
MTEIIVNAKANPAIEARSRAVMIRAADIPTSTMAARPVKVGPVRVNTLLFRKLNLDIE